jgi:quinol monooxygenase YgiN
MIELFRFSIDRLRGRPGCLTSEVYETCDEKQTILYLERWTSEEELSRHIESNLYLAGLNAIDLAMEVRKADPDIPILEEAKVEYAKLQ